MGIIHVVIDGAVDPKCLSGSSLDDDNTALQHCGGIWYQHHDNAYGSSLTRSLGLPLRCSVVPSASSVTSVYLMHSCCSLISLFDPVNGGVCQCIFSRACLKLLLPRYSTVHPPTVIIGTLYHYGTVVWLY